MSDPKILAEFDFQMISNLNINNYFKYLFLTLLGQVSAIGFPSNY